MSGIPVYHAGWVNVDPFAAVSEAAPVTGPSFQQPQLQTPPPSQPIPIAHPRPVPQKKQPGAPVAAPLQRAQPVPKVLKLKVLPPPEDLEIDDPMEVEPTVVPAAVVTQPPVVQAPTQDSFWNKYGGYCLAAAGVLALSAGGGADAAPARPQAVGASIFDRYK